MIGYSLSFFFFSFCFLQACKHYGIQNADIFCLSCFLLKKITEILLSYVNFLLAGSYSCIAGSCSCMWENFFYSLDSLSLSLSMMLSLYSLSLFLFASISFLILPLRGYVLCFVQGFFHLFSPYFLIFNWCFHLSHVSPTCNDLWSYLIFFDSKFLGFFFVLFLFWYLSCFHSVGNSIPLKCNFVKECGIWDATDDFVIFFFFCHSKPTFACTQNAIFCMNVRLLGELSWDFSHYNICCYGLL